MECRETVVVSPIAFSFEAMHISDPTDNNDTSPRRHSCPDKRSLSWNGCVTPTDGIEQQPLIKVGSGEFGCIRKKIKKQRPSTQARNLGFCVEQLISQRFTEEEAELTTLCLDLMGELARQQKTNVSPPRCPAPDPIAQTRPRKPKGLSLSARESTGSSHPFGLRPRPQKKKGARLLLPTNFSSLTDDEDDEDSDSSPPSSPTYEPHQEKEPKASPSSASLKRCHSMGNTNSTIDIPTLDFAKLSVFRERGVTGKGPLLSPHPSPPRSPSSPTGISKPDGARYNRIEGSPRSAFVKPSTS